MVVIELSYILAAALFIIGLKMLSSAETARKGNLLSAVGMLLAIIATLLTKGLDLRLILLGGAIGTIIGVFFARTVAMTQMPEMVALLNGFGGLASLLVGTSAYLLGSTFDTLTIITIILSILIGGVTFSGSVIAWSKLNGRIPSRPILFHGQQIINAGLLLLVCAAGLSLMLSPTENNLIIISLIAFSLILGITSVIPIGGADMPVVISLLNSYSGLAACASGFVVKNNILIVAGALVGASGIILTQIMCKAMNRSLKNVLFSGFGTATTSSDSAHGKARSVSASDAYIMLEAARSVVFVPGYGLAVAQAQHILYELTKLLENNGAEVRFAIHPVAGRMPGHMNVLLAEANVPYDQLYEMDEVNRLMDTVDVCVIIGANDVVNPAAIHDAKSPIYGMPIIEAHRAKTVFILKRSMASGFAGIPNPLFYKENSRMLFGDAKASLQSLVGEFKQK